MAFVQAWTAPSSASLTSSVSQSGAATSAGNDLFVSLVVRSEDVATVTITDDGDNTYTEVAHQTDTLMYVGLFRATNAAAATSVTASWVDDSSEPVNAASTVLLEEYSAIGDLVDTSTVTTGTDGGQPDPITATEAGQTLIAVGGSNISNRTWASTGTGLTPTDGPVFQGQQITHLRAYGTTGGSGSVAIGWDRVAGSASSVYIVNGLFEEGSGGPSPLSVDVGADQSVYVGQTASVTATPTGGTPGYTYAWTKVSGPTGSFLNANQASTSFNPSGGAGTYVLRCIVTDANTTVAQDDLTLTVTAAPAFVTISTVNSSSGWTPTGGTVQQVLSDTSDSTLITSQEAPSGQGLDVTFNEINLADGQPLVLRTRARRVDSGSASFVAKLYSGSTLLSTSAAVTVSGTFADLDVTFPADDFDSVSLPATFRVVTEWTAA